MIIPSNINLTAEQFEKYTAFIEKNKDKIKAVLLLICVNPFKPTIFTESHIKGYYKAISDLSNKYSFDVIGIFDEKLANKYSPSIEEDIRMFSREFQEIYNQGIKVVARPNNWYNYNFNFFFSGIKYLRQTETNNKLVKRTYDVEIFFEHLYYLENGVYETPNPYLDLFEDDRQDSKYKKRFSIAHPDNTYRGRLFYENIKNASPKLRSEIDDIYFGKEFIYNDGFTNLKYGNVMGVSATDEQLDYLFKIQKDFKINISLTLNETVHPPELLLNSNILRAFINWIGTFYDRGLRVCTISNVHLMKIGILQKEFPQMKWKNSVNHLIKDTQSFLNYANIGYNFIQVDRSLSRNMNELKKIKIANENLKNPRKIYMLVTEFCMQDCPFKSEHDSVNNLIGGVFNYFNGNNKLSHISCDKWRTPELSDLPRTGVNLIVKDKDMLDEYFSCVDVFKISGRLMILDGQYKKNTEQMLTTSCGDVFSFEDLVNQEKLNQPFIFLYNKDIKNDKPKEYKKTKLDTPEGKKLLEVLTKCNNQCYDCHLCEKVFGLEPFDTLI